MRVRVRLAVTLTLTLTLLSFALVLLGMAIASFGWHASNCTEVHFVDIGLMNSVIAFFPLRFGFASAVHALRLPGQP